MFKKIFLGVICITMLASVGTAYAFEGVTPRTAHDLTRQEDNVFIIDVRTAAEWIWVGHPGPNNLSKGEELAGKVVNISYLIERNGEKVFNNQFLGDVRKAFGDSPDVTLIMMCRSGKRSKAAAILLEAEGYTVMNMESGFQGNKDIYGYRTVDGWAMDGFPYTISDAGAYSVNSDGNMK